MQYSCQWHLNCSKFWAKTWSKKELTVNERKGKESQSLYLLAAEKAADVFIKQLCPSWADTGLSDWKGTNANCAAWHASSRRNAAACVWQCDLLSENFIALGCNYQKLWRLPCSICALVQSMSGYPRSTQQGTEAWQHGATIPPHTEPALGCGHGAGNME